MKNIQELYSIARGQDEPMGKWEKEFALLIVEECAQLVENGGYWVREFSQPSRVACTPPEIASMLRVCFGVSNGQDET